MLPPDDEHPRDIWHALDRFLEELSGHLSKRRLRKVLFGNSELSGVNVGHKSEAFTEDELIFPLLESVDLQWRREPGHDDNSAHDRWPDFDLTNTAIGVIGENKPINRSSQAVPEAKGYLSRESFDTPYSIGTDGIDWVVIGPSEGSTGYGKIEQVSFRKSLQHIADQQEYADLPAFSSKPRENVLDPIAEFIETFRVSEFDEWMLLGLPLEGRRKYLDDKTGHQPSLAWFEDPKRRG